MGEVGRVNVERCACGWQLPLPELEVSVEGIDPSLAAEIELCIVCPGCGQRYATALGDDDGWTAIEGRVGDPLHPDGRCLCAAEGLCAYCRSHCMECGVRVAPPVQDPVCSECRQRVN